MLRFQTTKNVDHDVILLLKMVHDSLHFLFGLEIDAVVVLSHQPVFVGLSVLRHHDDRSCVGGLKTKSQVQQDEGIRIPVLDVGDHDKHYPCSKNNGLDDDERPAPNDI